MRGHFVTILFMVLALVLYGLGAAGPATGLLILGGLAELIFWCRIFMSRTRQ